MMSIYLSQLDLDPVAMIYHYDRPFANFRPDLCTVCRHLAKINARVYSVRYRRNPRLRLSLDKWNKTRKGFCTYHYRIHSKATFYKI